jgi:hypothetical protein
MKALSIQQPYAWLIVHGWKDIENRDWSTRLRGLILIHAGKRFDLEGYRAIQAAYPDVPVPDVERFELGGIVGQCDIIDCVTASASRWFVGPYGFVLTNARPLDFRPLPGKLGFFEVKGDIS